MLYSVGIWYLALSFMCTVLPFNREGYKHWHLWNKFQQRQHFDLRFYLKTFDPNRLVRLYIYIHITSSFRL